MSQHDMETSETGAEPDVTTSEDRPQPSRKRRLTWLRLVLVAALAAAVGAFVTANWQPRHFSFVVVSADINAGAVMLGCVAVGFVTGLAFVWSAVSGD